MLGCVVNKLLGETFLVMIAFDLCSRFALEDRTVVPDAVQTQYILVFWSWLLRLD